MSRFLRGWTVVAWASQLKNDGLAFSSIASAQVLRDPEIEDLDQICPKQRLATGVGHSYGRRREVARPPEDPRR